MGWKCIGYQVGISQDGNAYQLTDLDAQAAHVQDRNHELIGVAIEGDYSNQRPPVEVEYSLSRVLTWLQGIYGELPVIGHRQAAKAYSPTACPGDGVMELLSSLSL
jgi:hypothetical protein